MFSPRFSALMAVAALLTTITTTLAAPTKFVFRGGRPLPAIYRRQRLSADALRQNGEDAQVANLLFATLQEGDACDRKLFVYYLSISFDPSNSEDGQAACVDGAPALCNFGKWTPTGPCVGELRCYALPLVNSPGISTACDTKADALARIQATGATGGILGDAQADTGSESEEDTTCEDESTVSASAAPIASSMPRTLRGRRFGRRQLESSSVTEIITASVSDAIPPSTSVEPAASSVTTDAPAPSSISEEASAEVTSALPDTASGAAAETVTVVSTVTIFTVAAPAPTEAPASDASGPPSAPLPEVNASAQPAESSAFASAPSPEDSITSSASEIAFSVPVAAPTASSLPIEAEPISDSVTESSSASIDEEETTSTPVGGQITFSGLELLATAIPELN